MSIELAVGKDIAAMPQLVRESGLAMAARAAAALLDTEPGARDFASLLKELRATMAELRQLAEIDPGRKEDTVDRLESAGPRPAGTVIPISARRSG